MAATPKASPGDGCAYLVDHPADLELSVLRIVDARDPIAPREVATYSLPDMTPAIEVSRGYA